MNKKIISVALTTIALTFLFSACGVKTEQERLKDATVELSCDVVKKSLDLFQEMMSDPMNPEIQKKAEEMEKEMEGKMEEIAKKHGFENSEAINEAGKKYEEDKTFEEEVKKAVKAKCGLDLDEMENMGMEVDL